jgi:hypothetical protein
MRIAQMREQFLELPESSLKGFKFRSELVGRVESRQHPALAPRVPFCSERARMRIQDIPGLKLCR